MQFAPAVGLYLQGFLVHPDGFFLLSLKLGEEAQHVKDIGVFRMVLPIQFFDDSSVLRRRFDYGAVLAGSVIVVRQAVEDSGIHLTLCFARLLQQVQGFPTQSDGFLVILQATVVFGQVVQV